jgi:hypothetical protein
MRDSRASALGDVLPESEFGRCFPETIDLILVAVFYELVVDDEQADSGDVVWEGWEGECRHVRNKNGCVQKNGLIDERGGYLRAIIYCAHLRFPNIYAFCK